MARSGGQYADLAFQYPATEHRRQHGPGGYSSYEQYRDWLRDEFGFRCLVCLDREQWLMGRRGKFHIDHVKPQSSHPESSLNYDNLVYVCARCNLVKSDSNRIDPCKVVMQDCLRIASDGTIGALSEDGQVLIGVYRLDSPELVDYRARLLEVFRLLETSKPRGLRKWLGFPSDLPDLSLKRPPFNSRPEGVSQCFFALRERGELPDVY